MAFVVTVRCGLDGGGSSTLRDDLRGRLILAPLTKGGNYAFRRLCAEFGAEVTVSEMAYARKISKGDRKEKALFVRAPNERTFGVQIATNNVAEAVAANDYAVSCGAKFLDLNCGCPIREVTRRGLGSALLRKPNKLVALVERMCDACSLPVTVKVRTGLEEEADPVMVTELVTMLGDVGAAAVAIHGRTAQQRYSGSADWDLIATVARNTDVGIVGNGDILTHYEAKHRLDTSGCLAVMTGRGALIKPWIFQEFTEEDTWNPSTQDRIRIYHMLVTFMKEKFGDDDRGRVRSFDFLRLHFDFFVRYRYFPEERYGEISRQYPLLQTRDTTPMSMECDDPLEALLQQPDVETIE